MLFWAYNSSGFIIVTTASLELYFKSAANEWSSKTVIWNMWELCKLLDSQEHSAEPKFILQL